MYLKRLIFLSITVLSVTISEQCKTPNDEEGECILLKACHKLVELLKKEPNSTTEYVQKSICGVNGTDSLVCCASNKTESPSKPTNDSSKQNLLPDRRYCGYQLTDDYITNDTNTALNEFPWQAVLLYNSSLKQGRCAGALINKRYVVTAAYCISPKYLELKGVRLGEYNTKNDTDCIKVSHSYKCSDPPEDFGIQKKFRHPNYDANSPTYISGHDIGLIRLDRSVQFSDYIQPICLPFPGTNFAKPGDILFSSGFGINPNTSVLTDTKKKVSSELITNDKCLAYYNDSFEDPSVYINENSFCTLITEASKEISCFGDGGGPVMYSHGNQWHIEGIASFGSTNCKQRFPEVHTKVSKYLDWILENLEP